MTTQQLVTIFIAAAGLLCTVGVAVLGVVWRLGTRTGQLTGKIDDFEAALKREAEAAEKWNADVIAAIKELDGRVGVQESEIHSLKNQWKTAHRIAQKVADLDSRLSGIEAVCADRVRCEISRPIVLEDGTPNTDGDSHE